ncbi:hypothetical protein HDU97_008357 [Phlyctochytrium planicorne]|nr:hypothetical protein HDU97_008357 [Phlyctochytrium planicorne]
MVNKVKMKRPTEKELSEEPALPEFHFVTSEETIQHFTSDADNGLGSTAAETSLQKYGPNELFGDAGISVWKVLFANTVNSMNAVLVTALIVGLAVQDWIKAGVLLLVIVTNSGIGFWQEFKSEKTMDALRKMSSPTARVLRNHDWQIISSSEVVPGDIVALEEGDVVPADIRLISVVNLETDESLLTGEAMPISKHTRPLTKPADNAALPLGDRKNCAYRNTTVSKGRGHGIVFATGLRSEVGKIARLVSAKKEGSGITGVQKTPLQKSLDRMMFFCLGAAIILGVIVFAVNKFQWDIDIFLYAIAVGIAILPEGLPAVVTVSMAVGLKRMSQQKAIVRRLAAIEAVGQVTNICSDKTGTLTEGKMVLKTAWFAGNTYTVTGRGLEPIGDVIESKSLDGSEPTVKITKESARERYALEQGLLTSALCVSSTISFDDEQQRWKSTGDPTEVAVQVFAAKLQFDKKVLISQGQTFVAEYPFDSNVKRMTVVYSDVNMNHHYYSKGAVERVLERCTKYVSDTQEVLPLTESFQSTIFSVVEEFAGRGMRVLALASKMNPPTDEKLNVSKADLDEDAPKMPRDSAESDLTFLGLVAIYDPPRPESLPSVLECQRAGIVVHMATGDHPKTAEAIAREVGILKPGDREGALVITAAQFDAMTDAEVDALPELPRVLARCSPESKVRLVAALHRRKKFVAMTGDGVNDAPAVRQADIGIAMGLGGSDVTKQASAITLTDDNFKTILVAVKEGRRLFTNSSLIALHLLSGNVSEVVALVIGLAIRDQYGNSVFPMSAIQILWLNMVTSSPVALALGMELASKDVMNYPPRAVESTIWTKEFFVDNLFYGLFMGALSLSSFILQLGVQGNGFDKIPHGCNKKYTRECDLVFAARGMAFYSLSLLLLAHGFNCRHTRLSIFNRQQPLNKYLWYAVILGLFVTVPSAYIPGVDTEVFNQLGFTWGWGYIIGQIILFLAASELYKLFKRNFWFKNEQTPSTQLGDPELGFMVTASETTESSAPFFNEKKR